MKNAKVLGGNILVLPEEKQFKTASGIILPHAGRLFNQKGKVIAVGGGKEGVPMTIEPGDTVHFIKRAGMEMVIDKITYRMMTVDDVLCIETENK